MLESEPIYDCLTCGACCSSPWTGDGYVFLYDADIERLRPTGLPIIYQIQGGETPEVLPKLSTKISADGARNCIALDGTIGDQCGVKSRNNFPRRQY